MDDNEKELSREESLLIIQQMINTAKIEQKDDGKGWIIWGWMLFTASVLTILNLHYHWLQLFFFWNLFGAFTVLYFAFRSFQAFSKGTKRVKTYTKSIFEKLNTGFFIMLMFIILSMNISVSVQTGFSLLIGLYGFWVLIYGTALDFRPSVIASFIMWALGLLALFQKDFIIVMLLHAAAVLCGYIIPGHLAYRKFKHESGSQSLNQGKRV